MPVSGARTSSPAPASTDSAHTHQRSTHHSWGSNETHRHPHGSLLPKGRSRFDPQNQRSPSAGLSTWAICASCKLVDLREWKRARMRKPGRRMRRLQLTSTLDATQFSRDAPVPSEFHICSTTRFFCRQPSVILEHCCVGSNVSISTSNPIHRKARLQSCTRCARFAGSAPVISASMHCEGISANSSTRSCYKIQSCSGYSFSNRIRRGLCS